MKKTFFCATLFVYATYKTETYDEKIIFNILNIHESVLEIKIFYENEWNEMSHIEKESCIKNSTNSVNFFIFNNRSLICNVDEMIFLNFNRLLIIFCFRSGKFSVVSNVFFVDKSFVYTKKQDYHFFTKDQFFNYDFRIRFQKSLKVPKIMISSVKVKNIHSRDFCNSVKPRKLYRQNNVEDGSMNGSSCEVIQCVENTPVIKFKRENITSNIASEIRNEASDKINELAEATDKIEKNEEVTEVSEKVIEKQYSVITEESFVLEESEFEAFDDIQTDVTPVECTFLASTLTQKESEVELDINSFNFETQSDNLSAKIFENVKENDDGFENKNELNCDNADTKDVIDNVTCSSFDVYICATDKNLCLAHKVNQENKNIGQFSGENNSKSSKGMIFWVATSLTIAFISAGSMLVIHVVKNKK